METMQEMSLIGHYYFPSKDKTKHYYVVQALSSTRDVSAGNFKSHIVDVFVSEDIYNAILEKEIGTLLNVQITPNLSTGKLSFKICL